MILYFSGTGNSEYAAKRIGKAINDEAAPLFEKIRSRDYQDMRSDRPWVITAPTYAWRIPRIVQEWLEKTKLYGNQDIYFVLTCAGGIGNAGGHLQKLCDAKKLHYMGCAAVVMPENYIALFSAPAPAKALEIIEQSENAIDQAAQMILGAKAFAQPAVTVKDRMNSGIVNDIFYPLFVHAKKFTVSDACISCGKCVRACPLSNIRLQNKKPVWGTRCTHCMACISRCPSEAIEYGEHTKGLQRYTCPKSV